MKVSNRSGERFFSKMKVNRLRTSTEQKRLVGLNRSSVESDIVREPSLDNALDAFVRRKARKAVFQK